MTVSWGILATGSIAHKFADDLALVDGHRLAAVGSRSADSAQTFAERHADAGRDRSVTAHGDYTDLAADPDVDVVYVATPHSRHLEDVVLCLEHGKAVLCEKPLTLEASTAVELAAEARGRGLFLAEAMWMRTNPAIRCIASMVADGSLGRVRQVRAELGFVAPPERERLWQPELGASAVLDIGIYPLSFATLLLGPPVEVRAAGHLDEHGVDVGGGATLVHEGGAVSSLAWTQEAWSDNRASVSGDGGRIEVPARFHHPSAFTYAYGESLETITAPVLGRGYGHEIEEVGRCLRAGLTESELLPLDAAIGTQELMDEVLRQIAAVGPAD